MLYPEADPEELGELYVAHTQAMTAEGLHSKSDIAAQLAARDKKINDLCVRLVTDTAQGTEAEVCKDIAGRQELGIKKYGVQVADNDLTHKQWLQHAYEEALDLAVYLKEAMKGLE